MPLTLNNMFNFTPPSRGNVAKHVSLALLGLFFIGVFVCGYRAASSPVEVSSSVSVTPTLFYIMRSARTWTTTRAACSSPARLRT